MRCGFCGLEFDQEDGNVGCPHCPMAVACKMVKCPRCNYENPPETALVRRIRKLFAKRG
jgi:DNA-directed RNA polymerase subunit RPC12/RpoP